MSSNPSNIQKEIDRNEPTSRPIIVGTAGHIDHGKSTLVQALTGKDPDRLPEEKKRGITIDLGFADLDLDGVRFAFVDVPGHERFVKNMLAGVHGIDAVALVIAADEGVMPQTREHFDICRLLGVSTGLVVITKTDLVEDELLELVKAEAEELVAGSFLEESPLVAVSARTGDGLEQLRAALGGLADAAPARSSELVARLPIDRAFSMKGFGVVVTGTLVSGAINEGDELQLLPSGRRARVRGIQVHGAAQPRAVAGQRTAVNLAGVDAAEVERGMLLAQTGRLRPTQMLDVRVTMLPSAARGLRTRARVRVHIGAAEILARVKILETAGEIAPGESGFAQLRLESPVVAVVDERLIIRSYSPSVTIGGAVVLDPFPLKHRGRDLGQTQSHLTKLFGQPRATRVAAFIEAARETGLRPSDLAARTGWTDAVVNNALNEAQANGAVVHTDGVYLAQGTFEQLAENTLAAVKIHHQRDPLTRGLARETLREKYFSHSSPEVFRGVLAKLEAEGQLVSEQDVVRSSKHSLALSPADMKLRENISAQYETAGLEAPTMDQAFAAAGVPAKQTAHARKLLQLSLDEGSLVRVNGDLIFHASALQQLKQKLQVYAEQHADGLIDVAAFKDMAGVSRKYAIPLLEYLDRERITRRAGDKRLIQKTQ